MKLEKEQNGLFELIAIILGSMVGGILFISFLTYDFKSDTSSNVMAESKIKENIQPVAQVVLAQATPEGSVLGGNQEKMSIKLFVQCAIKLACLMPQNLVIFKLGLQE